MTENRYISIKEKRLFWTGIGLGIGGGILGNLFTSLWTELLIRETANFSWGNLLLWITFIIISILTMGVILWIGNQLSKLKKIKNDRHKH